MTTATNDKPSVMRRILRPFLSGLLAALPLALTLAILFWLIEFVHRVLGPASSFGQMLRSIGLKFAASDVLAYLVGVIAALAAIYFLGLLVEAGMKNRWNALVDLSLIHI